MRNKFINNASWIIGGRLFQMAVSLIVSMITARYLGPSNYGIISYGASFVAFFTGIASLGLNNTIVNELINHKDQEGTVLGTGMLLQLLSGLASSVAIVIIVYVLNSDDKITFFVTILQSISLAFQAFQLINYWYQSKLKSKISTIVSSIAYIIVTSYNIFLLILGKSVLWFAFASTLSYLVIALFLFLSYKKNNGKNLQFSTTLGHLMLKRSCHFILPGLMVAIYGQIDKMMIGSMMTKTAVGYYFASLIICTSWVFLLGAIIDSARPIIMEHKVNNEILYEKRLKQLYAAIIWTSIFVSVFICIFAKWIVLILYGEDYLQAVIPLRIITWYTAFSYLGVAKNIWLICEHKEKYLIYLSFAGAASNVALNILLIPTLGIAGAAIASLVTQLVTNFLMSCIIKDLRLDAKYICDAFLLRGVVTKQEIINSIHKKK